MTANAQAALQAAVTLHARLRNGITAKSRRSVECTADQFLAWLDENTPEPTKPSPVTVHLGAADRRLLQDLKAAPITPQYPYDFSKPGLFGGGE